MIRVITRISPLRAAKVLALLHLFGGLIASAIAVVCFLLQETPEPYSGLWPIGVFLYAALGFVFSFATVLLYNLVAKFFGGIRIETRSEPPPNNRLQRTVRDKVPASITRRPAAEPGR
jgi:hypothetical protein